MTIVQNTEKLVSKLEVDSVIERLEYDLIRIPTVKARIPLYEATDPKFNLFTVVERVKSGDLQEYGNKLMSEDSYPLHYLKFDIANRWIQENAPHLELTVDIITTADHFNEYLSGREHTPFEAILQGLASDTLTSLLGNNPNNPAIAAFRDLMKDDGEPIHIAVLPGHAHVRSQNAFNLYYPSPRPFTTSFGGLDLQKVVDYIETIDDFDHLVIQACNVNLPPHHIESKTIDLWYGLAEVGFVQFADVAHWDSKRGIEEAFKREEV